MPQPVLIAPNTAIITALWLGLALVLALTDRKTAARIVALGAVMFYGLTITVITILRIWHDQG